jgi:hypothetical protein
LHKKKRAATLYKKSFLLVMDKTIYFVSIDQDIWTIDDYLYENGVPKSTVRLGIKANENDETDNWKHLPSPLNNKDKLILYVSIPMKVKQKYSLLPLESVPISTINEWRKLTKLNIESSLSKIARCQFEVTAKSRWRNYEGVYLFLSLLFEKQLKQ